MNDHIISKIKAHWPRSLCNHFYKENECLKYLDELSKTVLLEVGLPAKTEKPNLKFVDTLELINKNDVLLVKIAYYESFTNYFIELSQGNIVYQTILGEKLFYVNSGLLTFLSSILLYEEIQQQRSLCPRNTEGDNAAKMLTEEFKQQLLRIDSSLIVKNEYWALCIEEMESGIV